MEKAALQLAILADDAFEACTTAFINIITGTIREYGNVNYMRKCGGSPIACTSFATKTMLSIKEINSLPLLNASKDAEKIVEGLYKYSVSPSKEQMIKIQGALQFIIKMAKIYRKLSILATQFANGIPVLQKINDTNIDLHVESDDMKAWANLFPEEFKPLLERNHIGNIGPAVAGLRTDEQTTVRVKSA